MIKRMKFLIIIMVLFLTIPLSVDAKVTCSQIADEVENYNTIVGNMADLDCEEVEDTEIVSKCNKYNTEKALSLSTIFAYNDENTKCDKSALKKIVEENKGKCTNVFGTELKDLANTGLNFFYVIAPFLLLIFGMLDFSKIVVMSDPSTIKESRKKFVRRLISFVLVFFIPVIANFFLNFNILGINYNSNVYSCKSDVIFQLDRWETIYIPQTSTTSNGLSSGSASSILEAAKKLHDEESTWCYYTDKTCGGSLYWNNIEKSVNNPNKVTCCATLVGATLYVAGIFSEEEMNSYNYNYVPTTDSFLASKGWTKITSYDELEAGDIVIMTSYGGEAYGHTQIYAGNGTWYNAGSTKAIQRESPYTDTSYSRSHFMHAYRKP